MNNNDHIDAEAIIQRLRHEKIPALFHFTSIENLPLIKEMNSLCSKEVLEKAGKWPPPEPGGNELSHNLDRANQIWDKVSFNFTPYTPFAYRKKQQRHLCFFVVDIRVASREGVVFTDTNAASGNQQRDEGMDGLNLVDFNAVRSKPRGWDRAGWIIPVQAETLVPNQVGLEDVIKVGFVSQASLEEATRIWGSGPRPNFVLKPKYFSDTPSGIYISFPFLRSILLTDEFVDKTTAPNIQTHQINFNRQNCERITLLANVQASAGIKGKVIWRPMGFEQEAEFEQSKAFWHWPSLSIGQFLDGPYSLDYYLGQTRWATINFEVYS